MAYTIFYWIHVVSYLTWIAAFIASLFLAFKIGKAFETAKEKSFMLWERKASSLGAHIGALGILISGGAMASMPGGPQWGWFNIPLYNWLALKQAIFIIILILVGFSIKKSLAFKKEIRNTRGDEVNKTSRMKWKSAYRISLVIYTLV